MISKKIQPPTTFHISIMNPFLHIQEKHIPEHTKPPYRGFQRKNTLHSTIITHTTYIRAHYRASK